MNKKKIYFPHLPGAQDFLLNPHLDNKIEVFENKRISKDTTPNDSKQSELPQQNDNLELSDSRVNENIPDNTVNELFSPEFKKTPHTALDVKENKLEVSNAYELRQYLIHQLQSKSLTDVVKATLLPNRSFYPPSPTGFRYASNQLFLQKNNKRIVTVAHDAFETWEQLTGENYIRNTTLYPNLSAALSGYTLAIGKKNGEIQIWDLTKEVRLTTTFNNDSPVNHLSFAANCLIAYSSETLCFTCWDVSAWYELSARPQKIKYEYPVSSFVVINDKRIASSFGQTIRIFNLDNPKEMIHLEHKNKVVSMAVLSHQKLLSSSEHELYIWDLSTNTADILPTNKTPIRRVVSLDHSTFASVYDHQIDVWNKRTKKVENACRSYFPLTSNPVLSGKLLSANCTKGLVCWDLHASTPREEFEIDLRAFRERLIDPEACEERTPYIVEFDNEVSQSDLENYKTTLEKLFSDIEEIEISCSRNKKCATKLITVNAQSPQAFHHFLSLVPVLFPSDLMNENVQAVTEKKTITTRTDKIISLSRYMKRLSGLKPHEESNNFEDIGHSIKDFKFLRQLGATNKERGTAAYLIAYKKKKLVIKIEPRPYEKPKYVKEFERECTALLLLHQSDYVVKLVTLGSFEKLTFGSNLRSVFLVMEHGGQSLENLLKREGAFDRKIASLNSETKFLNSKKEVSNNEEMLNINNKLLRIEETLNSIKKLPYLSRLQILLDIAKGLQEMHREGWIHRDIKSSNIAINNKLRAKLIDFGIAIEQKDPGCHLFAGTLGYCPPEIWFQKSPCSFASDVFSFSRVIFEVLTGTLVSSLTEENFLLREKTMLANKSFPLELTQLYITCSHKVPEKRPTMDEIVSSLQRVIIASTLMLSPCFELFPAFLKKGLFPFNSHAMTEDKKKDSMTHRQELTEFDKNIIILSLLKECDGVAQLKESDIGSIREHALSATKPAHRTLHEVIESKAAFPWTMRLQVFLEIIKTLKRIEEFLIYHDIPNTAGWLIHVDLDSKNIWLTKDLRPQLAGFSYTTVDSKNNKDYKPDRLKRQANTLSNFHMSVRHFNRLLPYLVALEYHEEIPDLLRHCPEGMDFTQLILKNPLENLDAYSTLQRMINDYPPSIPLDSKSMIRLLKENKYSPSELKMSPAKALDEEGEKIEVSNEIELWQSLIDQLSYTSSVGKIKAVLLSNRSFYSVTPPRRYNTLFKLPVDEKQKQIIAVTKEGLIQKVRLQKTASPTPISFLPTPPCQSSLISVFGNSIAIGMENGEVQIFNWQQNPDLRYTLSLNLKVNQLLLTTNCLIGYSSLKNSFIYWDFPSKSRSLEIKCEFPVSSFVVINNKRIASFFDKSIRIFSLDNPTEVIHLKQKNKIVSMAVLSHEKLLSASEQHLYIWDLKTNTAEIILANKTPIRSVVVLDHSTIASVYDNQIDVWNKETGALENSYRSYFPLTSNPVLIGKLLTVNCTKGLVCWDLQAPRPRKEFTIDLSTFPQGRLEKNHEQRESYLVHFNNNVSPPCIDDCRQTLGKIFSGRTFTVNFLERRLKMDRLSSLHIDLPYLCSLLFKSNPLVDERHLSILEDIKRNHYKRYETSQPLLDSKVETDKLHPFLSRSSLANLECQSNVLLLSMVNVKNEIEMLGTAVWHVNMAMIKAISAFLKSRGRKLPEWKEIVSYNIRFYRSIWKVAESTNRERCEIGNWFISKAP